MGEVFEERDRVVDAQIKDVGDRKALVADFQRLAIESLAFADRAGDEQIGQELHFDFFDAVALAFLAAAPFDVETEAARLEAALFGFFGAGEHFANFVEDADVRWPGCCAASGRWGLDR